MRLVSNSLAGVAILLTTAMVAPAPAVDVHAVLDEANAALAILRAREAGSPVTPALWTALTRSAGYQRLAERERSLGIPFSDSSFRAFLVSDTLLARAASLERTVARWRAMDVTSAARRALAYLPANTTLRATLYPVIKPKTNSFVHDAKRDPAIFMYVDPAVSTAQVENNVAHELHHIGYNAACSNTTSARDSSLSPPVLTATQWASAFGEGLAMLAAAGSPDTHPHALDDSATRARWDRDMANAPADMARLERFFTSVLDGRLSNPDSVQRAAMEFFGVQGPWYTIGYLMASTIERTDGRAQLIAVECDPRALMTRYNAAARAQPKLPRWSEDLLQRLSGAPGSGNDREKGGG